MPVDERWPITRYGQDLSKAVPNAMQEVGGTRVFVPSLNKMPSSELSLSNIQTVTIAADVVDTDTSLLIIERVAPATTALQLPDVNLAEGTLGILDWSTLVVNHTITITPFAGQTIMQQPTLQIVSVGDGAGDSVLGSVVLVPVPSINGWMVW